MLIKLKLQTASNQYKLVFRVGFYRQLISIPYYSTWFYNWFTLRRLYREACNEHMVVKGIYMKTGSLQPFRVSSEVNIIC